MTTLRRSSRSILEMEAVLASKYCSFKLSSSPSPSFYPVTVALVSDQLPILVQLALNNLFFFEGIPAGHLSWLITIICLLMYLNILLYLRNDGVTFSALYTIITSRDSFREVDPFFLQSSPDDRLFRSDISLVQLFRGRLLPFGRLFVRASNLSTSKYPAILLASSPLHFVHIIL